MTEPQKEETPRRDKQGDPKNHNITTTEVNGHGDVQGSPISEIGAVNSNGSGPAPLSADHLVDLMDNHAITVDMLQAVNARDYPKGVVIDWTDGSGTHPCGRIDHDKRQPDRKGKIRKTDWSKGTTTNLSMARHDGADDVLIVEGFCQHLAVASWAPEKYDVFGMNGCNGIHDKTDLDWAEGKRIILGLDADCRTSIRVKAAARTAARHLYQSGAAEVRIWDLPADLVQKENDGPDDVLARMPEEEREAAVAAWAENATLIPKVTASDQFSDAAMAGVVADDVFREEILWASGLGWLRWTGQVWKTVDDSVPVELLRQFVLGKYAAAAAAGQRNEVQDWGRLLSRNRITSVVALARGIVRVEAADMDADPDLLNTPSGIVDLTTGKLAPSDPDQLMTRMTRVPYVPGARHADWDKALTALPDDVRDWYQLRVGQAITGHMTPDDLLIVSHGGGRNGKSAVLAATSLASGDYYRLLSDRVLMADPGAHPTELMDLMGIRFAALEETPEARRLDTQRLKKTIGTVQITARRIRQDSVTFDATHSLFVNTNHKPEVTETDHASWERLALLTWPYTYCKGPEDVVGPNDRIGDPTLRERCKTDPEIQTAALAWMVEGARRWYAAGKVMPPLPERIELDTLEWRKESDMVLAYIGEHLVFDPQRHVRTADLTTEVNRWLRAKEMHVWNDKTVAARFGSHSEFSQHGVTKKFTRASSGLSAPEHAPGADPFGEGPKAYNAWLGVRFREAGDDANQDHVLGVLANPVTPKKNAYARVTDSANTPNTPQVSGPCLGHPCCQKDPFADVIEHCPDCSLSAPSATEH